jgi:hypothetical protein
MCQRKASLLWKTAPQIEQMWLADINVVLPVCWWRSVLL